MATGQAIRQETEAERPDRNWSDLVQELRVAQTGVQVLAGLSWSRSRSTQPSTSRRLIRLVYLVAFSLAVVTVALMTAPVALHRFLFGRHEKDVLVQVGALFAKTGMATMVLTPSASSCSSSASWSGIRPGSSPAWSPSSSTGLAWVVIPYGVLRRAVR